MKRNIAILIFAMCLTAGISYSSGKHQVHAAGQLGYGAPCISYIPKDWGEFRGASSYGVEFEDSYGTIRLIKNPPCDISATPRPDLEIHRKR